MTPQTVPRSNSLERAAQVASHLRRLAFWGSVLLPLAYVPLLSGVAGDWPLLVAGLLSLNALCLLAGHGHSPDQ